MSAACNDNVFVFLIEVDEESFMEQDGASNQQAEAMLRAYITVRELAG